MFLLLQTIALICRLSVPSAKDLGSICKPAISRHLQSQDSSASQTQAANHHLQSQGSSAGYSAPSVSQTQAISRHLQAFADVVILNKNDLVSPDDPEELEKEIYSINSLANIVQSVRCQVDISIELDRRAYDASHAAHLEQLLEENKSLTTNDGRCISDSHKVDLDKVRLWLEEIFWDKKHDMDVYRCKGVLSGVNSDELHTIQGVREIYEIVPARK